MKHITLNNGDKVIVDDQDFEALSQRRWRCHTLSNGRKYAVSFYRHDGRRVIEYLHRTIVADESLRVSFKNGDTYDCRRANLAAKQLKRRPADAGAIGEAAIIYDLTKRGHDVYAPMAGHCAADLVSCKGNAAAIRWQIKLRSAREGAGIKLALHSIHPRRHGYDKSPINRGQTDALAIFNPITEQIFYVGWADIDPCAKSITITTSAKPNKNAAFLAENFTDPDRLLTRKVSQ